MHSVKKKRSASTYAPLKDIPCAKLLEKRLLPLLRRTWSRLRVLACSHGVDKLRVQQYAKRLIKVLFGFLMGLARFPQGIQPLGIAASCSFADADSVLCVYLGVALSSFFGGMRGLSTFVLYFFLYVGRKAFTASHFHEPLYIRVLESVSTSIALGILRIYEGRAERLYELAAMLALVALSSGFTVFFSTLFVPSFSEKAKLSTRSICLYAVMGAIVCSLRGWRVLGLDVQLICACVITLLFAAVNGFMHGGIVGFVCGLACFSTGTSAALGVAGMVAAFLFSKSIAAALIGFTALLVVCTLYSQGIIQAASIFSMALCADVLFIPVCAFLPELVRLQGHASYPKDAQGRGKTSEKELTDAFFSLADVFSTLAEKRKHPSFTDVSLAVDKSYCEVCAGCALGEMCYARRKTDIDELKQALFAVLSTRPAIKEDFGTLMSEKCIRIDALGEAVNLAYRRLSEASAADNRMALLSGQYAGMARVIEDASLRTVQARERDYAFEKSVITALKKADVPFKSIVTTGSRSKCTQVSGVNLDRFPFTSEEFRRYIFATTGVYVSEPRFDISEKTGPLLFFERAPVIEVEYAYYSEAANEKEPNGDAVGFVAGKRHRFFANLCDGMGSGVGAATASRLSLLFLEKMLTAGVKRSAILELLNTVLLSQSGEYFSTVDLLEVDQLNGRCLFIKAGAAPTYIFRGGKLYKIFSATPPVGILNAFTAESTRFDARPGDVIFMLSDGVVQGSEDGVWLAELIRMDKTGDVSRLAEEVVRKARELNERADDATAAVIRIRRASGVS